MRFRRGPEYGVPRMRVVVLQEEILDSLLSLPRSCEDKVLKQSSTRQEESSPGTESVENLILDFAASGMMKNTYLLFQFLRLWYFMLWQPEQVNIVCRGAPVVIGTKDLG